MVVTDDQRAHEHVLWPFDCGTPRAEWYKQYAIWKSDPDWMRIYEFVRHGYWHVTTEENWPQIRQSGSIKPNMDGRYSVTWPQTHRSFGFAHGYVALFDFGSLEQEDVIRIWDRAHTVLTRSDRSMILIGLESDELRSRIVPNDACWDWTRERDRNEWGCIPLCEVWYPGDIMLSASTRVYRIAPARLLTELEVSSINGRLP